MPHTATIAVDLYLHVRVLIGILLGLSVVRLVGGVARFVAHPGRQRISFIHLGWVAWALLNVVTFWWWEFGLSRIEWNSRNLLLRLSLRLHVFLFERAAVSRRSERI